MATAPLVARAPAPTRARSSDTTLDRARVAAAAGFLLGVFLAFLGFTWDIQWHTDVGPDTFFTAPHLVLYGGVAVAGITSLAMVLLTSWYARRGVAAALAGTTPILGGRFRGPLGYIIGGFGALFFLLAERSLDITFEPEGGIEGKSATIRITDPQGDWYEVGALGRHPRQRDLWGLDLIALPSTGEWTIELTVTGPEGSGAGTLSGIPVGPRPGPPPAPMWLIAALPLFFLLWLGIRGWFQVRPGQTPEAHAWA